MKGEWSAFVPQSFYPKGKNPQYQNKGDCAVPRHRHITWAKIKLLAMLPLSCAAHSIVPNRTELSQFPSITVTLSVMVPENLNSGITFQTQAQGSVYVGSESTTS